MRPEIVDAMHGARLPEAFTHLGWQDYLAMFGLGLLLAALLLWLLTPLLKRRAPKLRLADHLNATRDLPPEERALAMARLLVARGGHLPEDQRAALYAGEALDLTRLEGLIREARAR